MNLLPATDGKKIALAVVTFIVAGLLSLFFVGEADPCVTCPHERFLANHVCPTCTTTSDAADYMKYLDVDYPRHINTVFYGRPSFEARTYMPNRCGMKTAAPAASCKKVGGSKEPPVYICKSLGLCVAEHSMETGHLFYNEMRCSGN